MLALLSSSIPLQRGCRTFGCHALPISACGFITHVPVHHAPCRLHEDLHTFIHMDVIHVDVLLHTQHLVLAWSPFACLIAASCARGMRACTLCLSQASRASAERHTILCTCMLTHTVHTSRRNCVAACQHKPASACGGHGIGSTVTRLSTAPCPLQARACQGD